MCVSGVGLTRVQAIALSALALRPTDIMKRAEFCSAIATFTLIMLGLLLNDNYITTQRLL